MSNLNSAFCTSCGKRGFLCDAQVYAYETDPGPLNVAPLNAIICSAATSILRHVRVDVRLIFFCDRTKGCEKIGPWVMTESATQVPPAFDARGRI